MDTLRRPQDPLVSTKASALSSAPPHMGDGTPGHLFTPMESSQPLRAPLLAGLSPPPSCALFIAFLRKMAWQDATHSWIIARAEVHAETLLPSPDLLALARVDLLYFVEIRALGAQ